MFHHEKVAASLEAKRGQFFSQQDTFGADLAAYREALGDLARRFPTAEDLEAVLGQAAGRIGARPLREYDGWAAGAAAGAFPVQPFGRAFAHHEAARAWAESVIAGVTTVAVDGSQIMPWRDASIPVALVQAGVFANPHDGARPYLKDLAVEVLTPEDLMPIAAEDGDGAGDDSVTLEQIVTLRRFELETRTLADWMRGWRPRPGDTAPIAIFDGSLIVSFAIKLDPYLLHSYITAVNGLLEASEATGVPLVAYIDTSAARDLVTMLRAAFPERGLAEHPRLHDAVLWGADLAWGDATVPFLAARGDKLTEMQAVRGGVAFVGLRAAADRPPARLEVPRWVAERGELPRVLDVMRAEIIAGSGYPYAIETADAVAVVSVEDRARFYALFQRFADASGLPLTFSRKALSKNRRRR